jgi:L-alanine-DL-glutamate epimerase-like enolase superfamily enzyme
LWDLLGKKFEEPVYRLLGYKKAHPKLPYASRLFGDSPEATFEKARNAKARGYKAVKFGWGAFGKTDLKADEAQVSAAREGLGSQVQLMIDAGTIWKEDIAAARERLGMLQKMKVFWLEEPFTNGALKAYKDLSASTPSLVLAGGEGCNNLMQAEAMIRYAGLGFIQIDAGRIGGITVAKQVADLAQQENITYVNHTFTSHLALSASLQPYAGIETNMLCEYPLDLSPLAEDIAGSVISPDAQGYIQLPEQPGLGITVNTQALKKYLVNTEIKINGELLYITPEI